jgi:hypothetical protein
LLIQIAEHRASRETKEAAMRKLLLGMATAGVAALAATPAAAQYYDYGYSPYAYSYSPYSYGYSYPSYSYSYPSYGYGYSYPSYGLGYSTYGYSYPSYRYRSNYSCVRRHHRNGIVYYTRVC